MTAPEAGPVDVGRVAPEAGPVDVGRVARRWMPLAASWLLMGVELPLVSAAVARLTEPKVHLAAYAGVVFPVALLVESPIIMLLAASTALSRDRTSYLALRAFMHRAAGVLTGLHVLLAFTPLYDVLARRVLGAPAEVIEPARLGLRLMTPWTWAIAYRRFHQGLLITFNRSRTVGAGTAVRFAAYGGVLALGLAVRTVPGVAVAAAAVTTGVVAEAIFIGLAARAVVREAVPEHAPGHATLRGAAFARFYVPLALTALLNLTVQPLCAAGMSRMPEALPSLAVWAPLQGLLFLLQSLGIALNEVVISFMHEPGGPAALLRFARRLALALGAVCAVICVSPLGGLWFGGASGLPRPLAARAAQALWLGLPLPALAVAQSLLSGRLVAAHRTRGVVEADAVFLVSSLLLLQVGIRVATVPGLFVAVASQSVAFALQCGWLAVRTRGLEAGRKSDGDRLAAASAR